MSEESKDSEILKNHPYYIYGECCDDPPAQTVRIPIDEPEGINAPNAIPTTAHPDLPRDAGGKPLPGAVSLTEVEVLDLLSEGEIDSLVDREYTYVGTAGNVGWTSATESLYNIPVGATVRWLRSVFWNEVPVVNSKDEFNFSNIQVKFTPGLPNGSVTSRINETLTYSRSIGERLRYGEDFAKTYRILNRECRAVQVNIKVGQLSVTSKDPKTAGDVVARSISYQVFYRPVYSAFGKTPDFKLSAEGSGEIKGKISFGYIKNTTVTLFTNNNDLAEDADFLGWEIKIQRTTLDSTDLSTRNQTYVDSITEVYGDKFSYPNSAIVASKFSAEFFSQVPNRAYDARLLKVLIPSNYEPIAKNYDESPAWDGTFAAAKQWTDNPAWCYYDLITNKRYGLGKFIDSSFVDKWTLYQIGKYCDTLVSDGEGNLEPRFTCNLIIASRDDAYKVVNDMASIFRAMTYYGAGTITAIQDSSKAPMYQFTNANVENGDFNYSSSSRRVRHTVGLVRYNDKKNFYKPAVEYVEDIDGIRKYGIREVDLTAFGCTSRGQAIRYGRWALLSETLETESVSFVVGTDGAYIRPGDIVQIFDANRHVSRYGGRTYNIATNGSEVTLDSWVTGFLNTNTYKLSVLTPTYTYDPTQISDLTSDDFENIRRSSIQTRTFFGSAHSVTTGSDNVARSIIPLSPSLNNTDYDISNPYVWLIENSGQTDDIAYNQWDTFRVIRNEEQEDGVRYGISAIEYNDTKFLKIESGLGFEEPNYGVAPTGPKELELWLSDISENSKIINYKFTIENLTNVSASLVYVKKGTLSDSDVTDSTYLTTRLPSSTNRGTYFPTENGTYCFRVYTINAQGTKSSTYASECIDVFGINLLRDVIISSLRTSNNTTDNAAGTKTSETITDIDTIFNWQVGLAQTVNVPGNFTFRVTFRKHSEGDTPSPIILYSDNDYTTNDNHYELTFDDNQANLHDDVDDIDGPFREYDVVVEVVDSDGNSSAGGNYLTSAAEDSDYSNHNGYDIVHVNNPRIVGFNLNECDSNFCSDAWISPEGEVKIQITQGTAPADLAGGYIYTCPAQFTEEQSYGLEATTNVIQRFEVTDATNNILVANPNYSNLEQCWISLSMFDSFDEALIEDDVVIYKELYFSPVKLIKKRGKPARNTVFSAWVDFDLYFGNQAPNDWTRNLNIAEFKRIPISDNLRLGFPLDIIIYDVVFKEGFSTNNYAVVISHPWANSASEVPEIRIVQKRSNGFSFTLNFFGIGDIFDLHAFIGVITTSSNY